MPNKRHFWIFLALAIGLCLLPPQAGNALPSPMISILSPGDGSAVTSPIDLSAQIRPDSQGLIRVTLLDQNNNPISRQLLRASTDRDAPIPFTTQLVFETPAEETQALLTLSLQDSAYRLMAVRSVSLTLLSDGKAIIQTPPAAAPWLTITQPNPQDSFSGGQLLVEGSVTPLTNKPIIFELITERTRVIGASQLAVENPGETIDFKIKLYYAFITDQSEARLVVRQTADPHGAVIILDSLPVILMP